MLKLDFTYAYLNDSVRGAPFETVRLASEPSVIIQPQEIASYSPRPSLPREAFNPPITQGGSRWTEGSITIIF